MLKYVKSQRSYGFLITKELIFGFQILDLKDHFLASLNDVTFKMFVTQMYLFVISFQLMFYKTLRYRLAKDSER